MVIVTRKPTRIRPSSDATEPMESVRSSEIRAFYRRGHRVFLIQDNASYHKKQETYQWFAQHRRYVEVFPLPPYWPELNATERIWNYTRKHATHNRYFEQPQHLCQALFRTFRHVQRHPEDIANLMHPFF